MKRKLSRVRSRSANVSSGPSAHSKRSPKTAASRSAIPGERVGTKRADRRWRSPEGDIWASRFEYDVYRTMRDAGEPIRRTTWDHDTYDYQVPVRKGCCLACNSGSVVQRRQYTPDLFFGPTRHDTGYYIEIKGYLRAKDRATLRAVANAKEHDFDLRLVIERDHKVTKTMTLLEWAKRYLKTVPVHVWNGDLPEDWK